MPSPATIAADCLSAIATELAKLERLHRTLPADVQETLDNSALSYVDAQGVRALAHRLTATDRALDDVAAYQRGKRGRPITPDDVADAVRAIEEALR